MLSEDDIIGALENINDPELKVNIVDLGLVYDVKIKGEVVSIEMTLTSPACSFGEMIKQEVVKNIKSLKGVKEVIVEFVWDPPWNPIMMNDEAKKKLGYSI